MTMVAVMVVLALAATVARPAPALAQFRPAPRPVPPSTVPAPPSGLAQTPPDAPSRPPVAGRVLSLDEAIAIALESQPQIQARLADYAAARYRVDQALSPLLPDLSGRVSATRSREFVPGTAATALTGRGVSGDVDRHFDETFAARVSLSQLIFDFGKTFASVDARRKLADIAREDVERQRQLITLAVKEAYTDTNFAQRLIRVADQALARAELNLRSARGFFEVGTRPKSDVTRAEVDVANARVELIRARNAARLGRVALNTAMGIQVDTPTEVQDNLFFQPVPVDPGQLRTEALRQRPEVRQARLQVEADTANVRRATRDFFPDITGSASYGGVTTDFNEAWEVTFELSWSIFDGGDRIARYREAKAIREAADATARATELDVSREVEQAQLIVVETEERIQAAQVAVASAQENFRLAQGRFDAGVGTILELTDAQLALTEAQFTEAQALRDFRIALARLDRAVGRR